MPKTLNWGARHVSSIAELPCRPPASLWLPFLGQSSTVGLCVSSPWSVAAIDVWFDYCVLRHREWYMTRIWMKRHPWLHPVFNTHKTFVLLYTYTYISIPFVNKQRKFSGRAQEKQTIPNKRSIKSLYWIYVFSEYETFNRVHTQHIHSITRTQTHIHNVRKNVYAYLYMYVFK